ERTPSFNVNAEEGFYYCWGCHASGDAITFVRATEHVDFVEAVRMLADRAGITIHEDAQGGAERKRRAVLLEAMERAVSFYHERLLSAPDAGPARDYLRSRGYDGEIVRRFRLGWAPDDWDALSRSLQLPERVLTDAALGFVNRRGRAQDAFRARVIFPICDPSGRPVALGGRILPPPPGARTEPAGREGGTTREERRPEPKYKNSSETAIYSKRRTLYALNWAKENVVATGEVVVCEGYTDVIGFFSAGVPRAVATCGTALAEEHFTLLRNFGKRIVLAYDADAAGQSAVDRVYEWERRHEVEVAVAALPAGHDPGDLARTDPDALRQAVADARPFLQFRVDRVFAAADLTSVEGRARAAETALDAVAEHPDDLVRDQYVMQVADRARLDPALVRERLAAARRRRPDDRPGTRSGRETSGRSGATARPGPAGPAGTEAISGAPGDTEERQRDRGPEGAGSKGAVVSPASRPAPTERPGLEALRLAVHRRDDVIDRLDEVLFVDDVQRRAYCALAAAGDLHEAVESAPPDVAQLLRRVAVEEPVTVSDPLVDPVDAVVAQLVRRAARAALDELQAAARTSPIDLGELATETATVRRWLGDLEDPLRAREAVERLVAWLVRGTRRVDGRAGPEAAFTRSGGD
ncbi:MAG TPA: DNA primase, partial [Acidimicrobiales bacterium]|nr:DNA primase [Acidimicrobiales bacterium]